MKRHHFLLAFAAAYIGLFCYIGLYAFPTADDYSIINMLNKYGFWQAQIKWYHWSPGLTGYFLETLAALGNFKAYGLLATINCAANIGAFYVLLRVVLRGCSSSENLCLAMLFSSLWLTLVPHLNEVLYWMSAMPYTWHCTALIFSIALLVTFFRSEKKNFILGGLCFALFFITALSPQVSITLCAVLALMACVCFAVGKGREGRYFLCLTAVSFAAFLVLYLAPGRANRMAGIKVAPAGHVLQTLKVAFAFGGVTALKFFISPIIYVLMLFMPDAARRVKPFDRKISAFLKMSHIVLLVTGVAVLNQAIHGFALGTPLAPRAEGMATWMMSAVWMFLLAFCYRDEKVLDKIEKSKAYHWRYGLLILSLLCCSNFTSLVRDMGTAPLYAEEMKARYAETERQIQEGRKEIFLPSLTCKPRLLFYRDLDFSPGGDASRGYSEYWGVNATACYPNALRTSMGKAFSFMEEVAAQLEAASSEGDPEVLFKLGEVYDSVFPVTADIPKDNARAARHYIESARQGYAPAQSRLIRVYATGAGVAQNYIYALGWLLRSQF